MPIITIILIEAICLIIDLFYFHAVVSHIIFVCVLIVAIFFSLFKNKAKLINTIFALPVVAALSTSGYFIEESLKNIVRKNGSACFVSSLCDIPKSYFGYRIQIVYKDKGRAKDMIVIDGYNYSFLIYDPATHIFERAER